MGKSLKRSFSVRLSEDEQAMLERVAVRFAGNKTAAMVEGLRALEQAKALSKDALLAELKRRLK